MTSVLLAFFAMLPLQDADSKKTSRQIFIEAQRLETVKKEYDRAVNKYKTAMEKAEAENNRQRVAESLRNIARCYENMKSVRLSDAMDAYQQIVNDYSEFEALAETARMKLALKGVDTLLARYAKKLGVWRGQKERGSAQALKAMDEEIKTKIQELGTNAISGLLSGLGHPDEIVRAFAAENLARVTNENGISQIIGQLDSDNPITRGGAALTLEKIFFTWKQARDIDEQADTIENNFNSENQVNTDDPDLDPDIAKAKKKASDRARSQASDLRDQADSIRGNLPRTMDSPRIQNALARVIADEQADPTARLEAASAALAIGSISGEIVSALADAMKSNNRNVRVGCARASAEVDTEKGSDKHRLADVMIKLVKYVPARDWTPTHPDREEAKTINALISQLSTGDEEEASDTIREILEIGDSVESLVRNAAYRSTGEKQRRRFDSILLQLELRRWANDAFVREGMVRALGEIGLVKSIPALIRALEDTSSVVRKAANEALLSLTGLDFDYESTPHVEDPGLEEDPPTITMDEKTKREKQAEIRNEGIQRWKDWWEGTHGVPVLMDRFWKFQSQWSSHEPAELFDKQLLMKNIAETSSDLTRDFNLKRAERLYNRFHRQKNIFVMDAVDLGEKALDAWMNRLDGSNPEQEKIFAKISPAQRKDLVEKSRNASRHFVAQVIARFAKKSGNGSSIARRLQSTLSGGGEKGAGAALAMANLDRRDVGSSSRSSLNKALKGYRDVLKEAAAIALMRVGDAENTSNLAEVAVAATGETDAESQKVRASIAALRALAVLKPRDAGAVADLGKLVGDEPKNKLESRKAQLAILRQYGCEALETMGDASVAPMILRARRDTIIGVRQAAASAIRKIYSRDAKIGRALAKILKNEDTIPPDRVGAALAIGDTGEASRVYDLVYRVIDENSPRVLRDSDPAVRAASCNAIGNMGNKTQFTIEALLQAMSDPAADVRQQAYNALRKIVGEDVASERTRQVQEGKGQNPEKHEFKGWYSGDIRAKFLKDWNKWYRQNKRNFDKKPPKDA